MKIFDPENEQFVDVNSKVGKKVIQNYNNKLKNKPIKSVSRFYDKFTIVQIDDSLMSDWYADISILFFLLEKINRFKTVNNRKVLNINEGKRLQSMHLG